MLEDLQAAQKKLGPSAPVSVHRDFLKALHPLAAALEEDDLAKAVKTLAALDKLKALPDPMKKEADALRERLTARGEEKIRECEEYVDPQATQEDLKKLADAFKGHPLEKKIREKLK